jgi:hypothetical protein
MPEPQPISCGKYSHGIPVCKTNKIPLNTLRSSIRLRPGNRKRRSTFGINGATNSHNSSLTSGFAICAPSFQARVTQPLSPLDERSLLFVRRSNRTLLLTLTEERQLVEVDGLVAGAAAAGPAAQDGLQEQHRLRQR